MNMLEALQAGTKHAGGDGRRLLFSEGRTQEAWEHIASSALHAPLLQELRAAGEAFILEPIPELPYSLYKLFDTNGDRVLFEQAYFQRRKRLAVFAMLALAQPEVRWLEVLEDVIWAICGEYSWCLPAHLGGQSLAEPNRQIGGSGRTARTQLDLFSAETAFYLGEITALLEGRLAPAVLHRVRFEVWERVLGSYADTDSAPKPWWEQTDMNWAAVCAGSIGAAAMYLIQDDQKLTPLLERVLSTMDGYLSGFPEDGACLEGMNYWGYGFGFFVYFAELLRQRTCGAIDLMAGEKVRSIAEFQQKSYLTGGRVLSYADTSLHYEYPPGLTHRLRQRLRGIEVPDVRYASGIWSDSCFRYAHAMRNLVWSQSELSGSRLPSGAVSWFKDAQILVSRTEWNGHELAFSVKGGHNGEPHNHNDLGSFILHADGQMLLADPGSGIYTKEYFGDRRYELIFNGSHGHSVPLVNGAPQQEGRERAAELRRISLTNEVDELELDLSRAYDSLEPDSLVRTFSFDKRAARVQVLDAFRFTGERSSWTERFVTFYAPTPAEEGRLVIRTGSGAEVELHYQAELLACEVGEADFLPGQPGLEKLYWVDFQPKLQLENEVNLSFEFVFYPGEERERERVTC
ncbi:hypothetical protein DCC85_03115 [Paenibacillus sp. CAA11]|uniref:heparinase II/III domain-containing protein n=1 Tax=Paenibacillus sp. CAA11 TaxID=1532905 RepID=UPI000D3D839F|nr:heparinase II/III family protein [Paenibacillus sp. CAA11]AWB43315.1 hypothetical protein DCC85_03115 [Paenibacillus sp. CAA11]